MNSVRSHLVVLLLLFSISNTPVHDLWTSGVTSISTLSRLQILDTGVKDGKKEPILQSPLFILSITPRNSSPILPALLPPSEQPPPKPQSTSPKKEKKGKKAQKTSNSPCPSGQGGLEKPPVGYEPHWGFLVPYPWPESNLDRPLLAVAPGFFNAGTTRPCVR
jgi:hypothetical protein